MFVGSNVGAFIPSSSSGAEVGAGEIVVTGLAVGDKPGLAAGEDAGVVIGEDIGVVIGVKDGWAAVVGPGGGAM